MGEVDAEVDAEKWMRVGGWRLENKDKSYEKKGVKRGRRRLVDGNQRMEIRVIIAG